MYGKTIVVVIGISTVNVVYLTSWFVTGVESLELDSFLTRIFSAGSDRFSGADEELEQSRNQLGDVVTSKKKYDGILHCRQCLCEIDLLSVHSA